MRFRLAGHLEFLHRVVQYLIRAGRGQRPDLVPQGKFAMRGYLWRRSMPCDGIIGFGGFFPRPPEQVARVVCVG